MSEEPENGSSSACPKDSVFVRKRRLRHVSVDLNQVRPGLEQANQLFGVHQRSIVMFDYAAQEKQVVSCV